MLEFNKKIEKVIATAPSTCSNIAVGFDILGFACGIGDIISLSRHSGEDVVIENIESMDELTYDPDKNVASAVIKKFCQDHKLPTNFSLKIFKGIPLGSGKGGSASSSVAALTALNVFLKNPVELEVIASYAMYGEEIACGSRHPDNVIPCVYGGMTLTRCVEPLDVIKLPIPDIFCVLVTPDLRLDTKDSRAALPDKLPLKDYVQQSANLASFIVSLYENDLRLMKRSLTDVLIEPWRAKLVKGFSQAKQAALDAGALGSSLSGSGPTVFALAATKDEAKKIEAAMTEAFMSSHIASIGTINSIDTGAKIVNIFTE